LQTIASFPSPHLILNLKFYLKIAENPLYVAPGLSIPLRDTNRSKKINSISLGIPFIFFRKGSLSSKKGYVTEKVFHRKHITCLMIILPFLAFPSFQRKSVSTNAQSDIICSLDKVKTAHFWGLK